MKFILEESIIEDRFFDAIVESQMAVESLIESSIILDESDRSEKEFEDYIGSAVSGTMKFARKGATIAKEQFVKFIRYMRDFFKVVYDNLRQMIERMKLRWGVLMTRLSALTTRLAESTETSAEVEVRHITGKSGDDGLDPESVMELESILKRWLNNIPFVGESNKIDLDKMEKEMKDVPTLETGTITVTRKGLISNLRIFSRVAPNLAKISDKLAKAAYTNNKKMRAVEDRTDDLFEKSREDTYNELAKIKEQISRLVRYNIKTTSFFNALLKSNLSASRPFIG